MSKFENNPTWVVLIWVLMSIAAVNWALVAQFDFNVVTEVFGNSGYYVFMGLGALGLIDLFETFGIIDIYD